MQNLPSVFSFPSPNMFLSFLLLISILLSLTQAQQEYVNNKQLDCNNYRQNSSTLGNLCNGSPSCSSYLTFKSLPPSYSTPSSISYLLNSTAPLIAQSNNITDVESIPSSTLITVPITCSCSNIGNTSYYQHNASYTIKELGETYFTVANNTYQALTTCQALQAQNPYGAPDLVAGLNLTVPLRCACPTKKQQDNGFNYLLTYLVSQGESVSSIAEIFGVDEQSVLDANQLSSPSIVFYFTPLLIPLKNKPPVKITNLASPPESSPPPQTPAEDGGSDSSKKWVIVGVAVGVVVVVLILVVLFVFFLRRRRTESPPVVKTFSDSSTKKVSVLDDNTPTTQSWSISSEGLRYAVESLTLYKFEDLENATGFFSEENKIKGSVYRASFKGDDAAVKILKGDVSSEINILKRINHANIIRLSGFCVYKGNTYLVYEFAENNSLYDWLHSDKNEKEKKNVMCLSWMQRVQIAHDVADALNYLHNYASPPHVHKNLKSGNVLLDGNFRAKVSNFGLARVLENDDEFQMTRHVVGTQGYLAPEYIENGLITPKMDVFAFGVVILELLSGREVAGGGVGEQKLLSETVSDVLEGDNFKGFMDPNLRDEYPFDLAYSMAEIAKCCVARDINSRPNVSEVFTVLSKIQSSTLDWDPSDELERSRSVSQISDSR